MQFLIDILVCIFIFITIYINYKKGLIEVAYKIIASTIKIIIKAFNIPYNNPPI